MKDLSEKIRLDFVRAGREKSTKKGRSEGFYFRRTVRRLKRDAIGFCGRGTESILLQEQDVIDHLSHVGVSTSKWMIPQLLGRELPYSAKEYLVLRKDPENQGNYRFYKGKKKH